jgi:hypothetical protein
MTLISTTDKAMDMMVSFLEAHSPIIGVNFVGAYDEKIIPSYPAVVVLPGRREKQIHATNTFQINLELFLYVYHGNLTLTKRERSRADMKLVTDLESLLEKDYEWLSNPSDTSTKQVIFGYISEEEPGVLQPRANKSNLIISTKLTWRALTQRRF